VSLSDREGLAALAAPAWLSKNSWATSRTQTKDAFVISCDKTVPGAPCSHAQMYHSCCSESHAQWAPRLMTGAPRVRPPSVREKDGFDLETCVVKLEARSVVLVAAASCNCLDLLQ
jgi:hypothetical protein